MRGAHAARVSNPALAGFSIIQVFTRTASSTCGRHKAISYQWEEWEPALGVWGALLVGWIISLPGTYILARLCGRFILAAREVGREPNGKA